MYGIARIVLTRPLRWLYGCEVVGSANLPARGPAILACSHSSNMDPLLVCISYPGQIRWMSKRELWRVPLLGWLIDRLGAFQVRRGEPDRDSIRRAHELLKGGWVVGIFPEGHRIRESGIGEFLPGVGMLALQAGVPVIPVRIHGDERVGERLFLSRPRITLAVGPSVDLEVKGMSRGRAFREVTERIRQAMAAL